MLWEIFVAILSTAMQIEYLPRPDSTSHWHSSPDLETSRRSLAIGPLQVMFLSVFPRTGKAGFLVPAIMTLVLIVLRYLNSVL